MQKQWIVKKKLRNRWRNQSAGCIFKNPAPVSPSAGMLIDQAGLKGTRIGGAEVSDPARQFCGRRSGRNEPRRVAIDRHHAQARVAEQLGVELELED